MKVHWLVMMWLDSRGDSRRGFSINVGASLSLLEDWLVIRAEQGPESGIPVCTIETTHAPLASEVEVLNGDEGWVKASLPLTIQSGEKFRIGLKQVYEFEALDVYDRKRP